MPKFGEYNPGAWGWQHGSAASIVPFTFDGHTFPEGVAQGTVPLFARALDILCAQPGFALPTSRSLDAGMWGYEDRRVGTIGPWSFHAYGLALDIAAPWNPQHSDPPPPSTHRVPYNTGDLLRPLGFEWGGDWSPGSVDWMHVELHLTPQEVADAVAFGSVPLPLNGPGPFPLPDGFYYGPFSGPEESISGSGRNDSRWRPGLMIAQRIIGATPDGYYGPETMGWVKTWQVAHGLEVDGLIGPLTWSSFSA